MTSIQKIIAAAVVAVILPAGAALAQDHHDDHHDDPHGNPHYVRHDDWRKGSHINHDDWNRGQQIDYRHYHLNAPPRGYQWRQVDGNYVLAAVATGVIASVIVASTVH
jgi:Ni/Co efflux regulator RcnB